MTVPVGRVLVVGAAASGLATVEALRRKGYAGEITVLGDESHAPYDRPPLSKQVLNGAWEPSRTALRTPEMLAGLNAEFVPDDAAIALDPPTRTVRTERGREYQADAIVIATGMRARVLPGQRDLAGVHVLRTLDDALALRKDLLAASSRAIAATAWSPASSAGTCPSRPGCVGRSWSTRPRNDQEREPDEGRRRHGEVRRRRELRGRRDGRLRPARRGRHRRAAQ